MVKLFLVSSFLSRYYILSFAFISSNGDSPSSPVISYAFYTSVRLNRGLSLDGESRACTDLRRQKMSNHTSNNLERNKENIVKSDTDKELWKDPGQWGIH